MQLTKRQSGPVLTVWLTGELDHHNAAAIRQELDRLLAPGIRELVLDLSGVSFMDSSGIGVVLGRYRTMEERGGKLAIAGANGYVERILRMAGVLSLVECR